MLPSSMLPGIILRCNPFQERHRIIVLLTKEKGVLSLFVRNAQSEYPLLQPLTRGLFLLQERTGMPALAEASDLLSLFQSDPSQPGLSLARLNAAQSILNLLLRTQLTAKPSPVLFSLTERILLFLQEAQNPESIKHAFALKLLVHEGRFTLKSCCARCQQRLTDSFYASGEAFCREHAPEYALQMSDEEVLQLFQFTHSRKMQELDQWSCSPTLSRKLATFVSQSLD